MTKEQKLLLQKAKSSLDAAKVLLNNQAPEFAAARAYYTMFYIAQAFLLKEQMSFASHAAVISAFGREFAKPNRIPREYHRFLINAQEKRAEADYNLTPDIDPSEATEIIANAELMLEFALNNIETI